MLKLSLIIAFSFLPFSYSFLFPSGGCGCQPPPTCIQLPPIQLPSLPSPCCGRKKRSSLSPISETFNNNQTLCNNPQIRKIILQNLNEDPVKSKSAIHSNLKAKLRGNYLVACSQSTLSFAADSSNYCIDGSEKQTCYVFEV